MKKKIMVYISLVVAFIVTVFLCVSVVHVNNIQDFQVVQSFDGETTVQSDGGFYIKFFPKIWTYPKVHSVFFSNEEQESKYKDGINVIFQNKGRGDISCQVVYRLYTNVEGIMKLHQYASGDMEVVNNLVLSKLKDIAMEHASNITSSQAIEDREQFASNVRKDIVNNKQLVEMGIVVEQFSITKITFDNRTDQLFSKQQEADLQKKTAEAQKQKLIMEKERTEADYAKQIAEAKGKAQTEMMKATTDAERQKRLAEIEASQKVEVQKLAKEKALIEAQKKLELAELIKKEESVKLQTIKIISEQKVTEAKAKEQQIKLSGAMTEEMKYRMDIEKSTKVEVARAISEGVGKMTLPSTMIIGGNGIEKSGNTLEHLLQMLVVQKAKQISNSK